MPRRLGPPGAGVPPTARSISRRCLRRHFAKITSPFLRQTTHSPRQSQSSLARLPLTGAPPRRSSPVPQLTSSAPPHSSPARRRSSLSPRHCRVASPLLVPLIVPPWRITARKARLFSICYPTVSFPEGGEPELPLRVVDHLLIGWTPSTMNPVFSKRTPLCGSPRRRGRGGAPGHRGRVRRRVRQAPPTPRLVQGTRPRLRLPIAQPSPLAPLLPSGLHIPKEGQNLE
ncbi:uncharacterized protein [Triticum aestivum]|uniref:uncharacterized protein n=1 Tax=Triticum aestivum TaxID=4565 RepID=UPI001D00DA92|nr:uncharacterized protein LOC123078159 [Triticum aestivum]